MLKTIRFAFLNTGKSKSGLDTYSRNGYASDAQFFRLQCHIKGGYIPFADGANISKINVD
jgi:hypothetical protein